MGVNFIYEIDLRSPYLFLEQLLHNPVFLKTYLLLDTYKRTIFIERVMDLPEDALERFFEEVKVLHRWSSTLETRRLENFYRKVLSLLRFYLKEYKEISFPILEKEEKREVINLDYTLPVIASLRGIYVSLIYDYLVQDYSMSELRSKHQLTIKEIKEELALFFFRSN